MGQSKASKYQKECIELRQQFDELKVQNDDNKQEVHQLKALNASIKDSMDTKLVNQERLNEIYNAKTSDLKESMASIERINRELNERSEQQQHELSQYANQLQQVQKSNRDFAERLEVSKNERLRDEQSWMDKEEDLRNEINIIRNQLHETTNDLGVMKLDLLEKDTTQKKLQNEIDGLNEELSFYKECQQKDKQEKNLLNEQLSDHSKSHEQKIKDIQMLMDSKTVRIMQLQEDNESKTRKIALCETQIMSLQYQIEEEKANGSKLQSIIDELSSELCTIKSEKSKLCSELKGQKDVNVQLSLELDKYSMKQIIDKANLYDDEEDVDNEDEHEDKMDQKDEQMPSTRSISVTDDALNKYSNMSFFDLDLVNRDSARLELSSSTQEILKNLNLSSIPKEKEKNPSSPPRRRPGLPLPSSPKTSQSSPNLPSGRGVNAEERQNDK